jgi:hypothetical protein
LLAVIAVPGDAVLTESVTVGPLVVTLKGLLTADVRAPDVAVSV